jgi:hypothetical protein
LGKMMKTNQIGRRKNEIDDENGIGGDTVGL